jgi:hypothetical protein
MVDAFIGWYYLVYDKYGHVQTSSATYGERGEALRNMLRDITPKKGRENPAAPYTAVLFEVPSYITITGEKFKGEKS